MAGITIRNLDDALKRRLRIRAAEHGRSMEEKARDILRKEVGATAPPVNLAAAIRTRIAPLGGSRSRPPHTRADTCRVAADRETGPIPTFGDSP
jgi:plasmid stability protein